jgi:hypothetical protein
VTKLRRDSEYKVPGRNSKKRRNPFVLGQVDEISSGKFRIPHSRWIKEKECGC